jgi:hypothetical protein
MYSVIAITAGLLSAAPLHAQRLGIVAGATFSQLHGVDGLKAKNRTGTVFGANLTLPFGEKIALQPELLFINKGSQFEVGNLGTEDIRLDYLEVPLLLRYDVNRKNFFAPHLYAGPSVGYRVGCNVTFKNSELPVPTSDCKRNDFDPKSVDYGAIVGGGVDVNLGGLGLTGGARYGIGLANIGNDNNSEFNSRVRNGTFTIYAGVLFGSP